MKRNYPAAVIAAVMTLVDARQRQIHLDFTVQTIRGFGGAYTIGRSKDHQTLAVTFEPSVNRKAEIAREIERNHRRVAELKPMAAARFDGEPENKKVAIARRDAAKKELKTCEEAIKRLAQEIEDFPNGYRDEFDLAELSGETHFRLATMLEPNTDEQQEAVETIEAIRRDLSLLDDHDVSIEVSLVYDGYLEYQATKEHYAVFSKLLCEKLAIGEEDSPLAALDILLKDAPPVMGWFHVENPNYEDVFDDGETGVHDWETEGGLPGDKEATPYGGTSEDDVEAGREEASGAVIETLGETPEPLVETPVSPVHVAAPVHETKVTPPAPSRSKSRRRGR